VVAGAVAAEGDRLLEGFVAGVAVAAVVNVAGHPRAGGVGMVDIIYWCMKETEPLLI
jgi:hypothetical protein